MIERTGLVRRCLPAGLVVFLLASSGIATARALQQDEPKWPQSFTLAAGAETSFGLVVARAGPVVVTVQSSGLPLVVSLLKPNGSTVDREGAGTVTLQYEATAADVQAGTAWRVRIRVRKDLVAQGTLSVQTPAPAATPLQVAQVRIAVDQRTPKPAVAPATGRACPSPLPSYANSTTNCTAGMISLACSPGFYDANGASSDGCEMRNDSWPGTFAAASILGGLSCGQSKSVSGNTAPIGSSDWFRLTLYAACPTVTLTLTGSGVAYYDVLEAGSIPPASPANAQLSGAHAFTPSGTRQVTVRIWSPALVTYTLTAVVR